jgi:hypothetical protein
MNVESAVCVAKQHTFAGLWNAKECVVRFADLTTVTMKISVFRCVAPFLFKKILYTLHSAPNRPL